MHALLSQLNKAYFWDVDTTSIDAQKSRSLIIERVMLYGNLDEIKLIKDFYGKEALISTICKLNYIDPKNLNFFSLLFGIPKSKFKCYTKQQLTRQPWNY
ncbi:hypothetical protein MASR1M74_26940 [Lentimicrobium sp.]